MNVVDPSLLPRREQNAYWSLRNRLVSEGWGYIHAEQEAFNRILREMGLGHLAVTSRAETPSGSKSVDNPKVG